MPAGPLLWRAAFRRGSDRVRLVGVPAFLPVGRGPPGPPDPIRPLHRIGGHFAEVSQHPHWPIHRHPVAQQRDPLIHHRGELPCEPVRLWIREHGRPIRIAAAPHRFRCAYDLLHPAVQNGSDAPGTTEVPASDRAVQHVIDIMATQLNGAQQSRERLPLRVLLVALPQSSWQQ